MFIPGNAGRKNSRNLKTGFATNTCHIILTEYPILLSNSITNLLTAFYTDHNNTFHRASVMWYIL